MTDFIDFLKTKQDEVRQQESNGRQRIQTWLDSLHHFYQQIEEWLGPAIKQGLLTMTQDSVVIDEEKLGSYSAPRLRLRVGADEILVQPVGTVVIGARGRVDLQANGRSRVLLLNDERWWYADHVFSTDVTYKELDANLFTTLLQTLLA